MHFKFFSWQRLWAIMLKEFIQMRRDRLTFAMMIGVPLIQLILFGYAINTNPKHLPTAVISADSSSYTRDFIYGLRNTDYFDVAKIVTHEKEAQELIQKGKVQFVITIPTDFTRKLIRGDNAQVLVEADATDPVATANSLAAVQPMAQTIFRRALQGSLSYLNSTPDNFTVVVHSKYNPARNTHYNIVPGLIGVVLTMTMVIITSMAITRERERGTMENLLATPARPLEVMIGKIVPYILVGYVQIIIILAVSNFLFSVPVQGSVILLLLASLPFIAANLAVGLTFSSIARNQLQAMQSSFFFFLPSLLLSGFMFPFRGMPLWAQYIGEMLPLTHFIRIVRGVMLKGNTYFEIWQDIWPITLFMIIAILIGLSRYRRTLD